VRVCASACMPGLLEAAAGDVNSFFLEYVCVRVFQQNSCTDASQSSHIQQALPRRIPQRPQTRNIETLK
jgi:hypothetical protein